MKKLFLCFLVTFISLMAISAFAADKVVVVPLKMKSSEGAAEIAIAAVRGDCTMNHSLSYLGECDLFEVPSGKILVIEHVSGKLNYPDGKTGFVYLDEYKGASYNFLHYLNMVPLSLALGTRDSFLIGGQLKAYVDEDATLKAHSFPILPESGEVNAIISFSGYLTDKN